MNIGRFLAGPLDAAIRHVISEFTCPLMLFLPDGDAIIPDCGISGVDLNPYPPPSTCDDGRKVSRRKVITWEEDEDAG